MPAPPDARIIELARDVERGTPQLGALEALGDPEPLRAVSALGEAARHPDLAASRASWLPELLVTARPGSGAEALVELAESTRRSLRRALPPHALAPLARVLGQSPFLARLLRRHPEWAEELAGEPPPERAVPEADWSAIRAAKYRGLLRIAARDLGGRSTDEGLRELSDLADGCLEAGLTRAAAEHDQEAPALFALGKLGGRELNFSSDVDVLFLYESAPGDDELARRRAVEDLVRTFKGRLEERTADGFGYRVDLDLRPEGRTGALANPVGAALGYYESFGADWERQMLIRLRPLSGAPAALDAFARGITAFVYRQAIDPRAIEAVRETKLRIESERRARGIDLDAELKEGPGGIRDVEFLVQALQLILGGRDPSLRTGNVLEALRALEASRALSSQVAESLCDSYRWLRRAEHSLQLAEERQTHRFPRGAGAQLELARRMGYRDGEGSRARDRLLDDWTNVRAEVRRHFEALVLQSGTARRGPVTGAAGKRLADAVAGTALAASFAAHAGPFLERRAAELGRRELSPEANRGLARVLASSAEFARYLSLRTGFVDRLEALAGAGPRVQEDALTEAAPIGWTDDLEGFLDALRLFRRDEMALAACFDLAGAARFEEISLWLSLLAERVVERALGAARDGLGAGGLEFAVLALGKLAGRELTYHSDLDLLFLYGGDTEQVHLASRVAQRMISYLSTSTGAGIAYAIDARLRPSGRQGTLVTSYDAYESYQLHEAQAWEHLALMRCRAVAGNRGRAQALVERLQAEVRERSHSPWLEVAELRRRIAAERTGRGDALALKTGAGGIMDADFLAKGAQLERGTASLPAVPEMLQAALRSSRTATLLDDYRFLRLVEARMRWVAGRPVEVLDAEPATQAVVAELVDPGLDASGLHSRLVQTRARVADACERVLRAGTISALAD